ncbi:MAG: tripartite tricarboxylate transporter substrate binding protein [Betaproteobacteria bacterium]
MFKTEIDLNPFRIVVLVLAYVLLPQAALAQAWPAKPIRFIVSFPPGGSADIIARTLAQKLSESLGQQVLADNRPGAGGNIGVDLAAKSAPDGYTIVLGAAGAIAINQSLMGSLPYDPQKDLAPIALLATIPIVLAVNPATPANTVRELIALSKAKPLAFASAGNGTAMHLAGELFKLKAGVDLQHVPYKGSGPAVTDLMGGQVPVAFVDLSSALPHIRSGKVRALAVASGKRTITVPEIATIAESGIPGYDAVGWFGLFAPAGTPREIVNKLNAEVQRIMQLPEVRDRALAAGAEPAAGTPEEFAAFIRTEIPKWAEVVKVSGAKAN